MRVGSVARGAVDAAPGPAVSAGQIDQLVVPAQQLPGSQVGASVADAIAAKIQGRAEQLGAPA